MPKIDTTTIQGFETMSDADKVAALLNVEIPEAQDRSGMIEKEKFDKVASELADLKKVAREQLPEAQRVAQEQKEQLDTLQSQYNTLLKESTISKNTAKYLSMGYSEKDAQEAAAALYEGNMDKVFEIQKRANEALSEKIKSDMIKGTPRPDGAGGEKGGDKTADIKFAERIGKQNAEANKASMDVLRHYI